MMRIVLNNTRSLRSLREVNFEQRILNRQRLAQAAARRMILTNMVITESGDRTPPQTQHRTCRHTSGMCRSHQLRRQGAEGKDTHGSRSTRQDLPLTIHASHTRTESRYPGHSCAPGESHTSGQVCRNRATISSDKGDQVPEAATPTRHPLGGHLDPASLAIFMHKLEARSKLEDFPCLLVYRFRNAVFRSF